jgi:hypothetical protein
MAYATWLIHLGLLQGSGRSQAARTTTGRIGTAAHRRRAAFQSKRGLKIYDI